MAPGRRARGGRQGGAGYTLIEVVFAAAVLLVGFLGLITLVYGGFSRVEEAGASSAAVAAAESMIEYLRTIPVADVPSYDRVTSEEPDSCPGADGSPGKRACQAWLSRVQGLRQGRGTVSVVTAPNASTLIPFHTVTVTVSWTEVGLGGRTVTLVTGITQ